MRRRHAVSVSRSFCTMMTTPFPRPPNASTPRARLERVCVALEVEAVSGRSRRAFWKHSFLLGHPCSQGQVGRGLRGRVEAGAKLQGPRGAEFSEQLQGTRSATSDPRFRGKPKTALSSQPRDPGRGPSKCGPQRQVPGRDPSRCVRARVCAMWMALGWNHCPRGRCISHTKPGRGRVHTSVWV